MTTNGNIEVGSNANISERGKQLVRFHGVFGANPTSDLEEGDMYYNDSTNPGKLYIYTGSTWVPIN